ncbi:MAG: DUF2911 domain-containing protein [Bacteroidota bacterium]
MKNFVLLLLASCLLCATDVFSQKLPGLDKSPLDMAYYPPRAPFRAFEQDDRRKAALAPVMRVVYSRPQLKGRDLATLVSSEERPYRLGANESAELEVFKEVSMGGTTLAPGRYSIFAMTGGNEWTLIVNSALYSWGSYFYDESKNVAEIKGHVSPTLESVEAMAITFSDDAMFIAWGNSKVEFPIKQSFPDMDKSPMDVAYYPSGAVFRARQQDAEKRLAMEPKIRVFYSRPQLKDRPLSELIKDGEVYRLGANENAELEVFSEIKMGGESIAPGRYSLYSLKDGNDWTIILNKDLDGWGAYAYNKENDVARFKVAAKENDKTVEALTITFADDNMVIAWANTMVQVPVE